MVELLARLAHEDRYCVIIVIHNPAIAEACDLAAIWLMGCSYRQNKGEYLYGAERSLEENNSYGIIAENCL